MNLHESQEAVEDDPTLVGVLALAILLGGVSLGMFWIGCLIVRGVFF